MEESTVNEVLDMVREVNPIAEASAPSEVIDALKATVKFIVKELGKEKDSELKTLLRGDKEDWEELLDLAKDDNKKKVQKFFKELDTTSKDYPIDTRPKIKQSSLDALSTYVDWRI